MCTECGCGLGETRIEGDGHALLHRHADGTVHSHAHAHEHEHQHEHEHEHEHVQGPGLVERGRDAVHEESGAGAHVDHQHGEPVHNPAFVHAGAGSSNNTKTATHRMVQVEQDILSKNKACADANRRLWAERNIFALNLVSSPGAGKTTLLVRSIEMLKGRLPLAVIEGDQQTSNDAQRIRATGATAIQINTGKGCHLDADMVGRAFERINVPDGALLFIENVGNLVCPAEFDLGEAHKLVILSVTEGEDKPLKYPNIFAAADVMLLTKMDLLPYVQFDVGKCVEYARRVSPQIEVLQLSSVSGAGMDSWLDWLGRGALSHK